MFFSNKAKRQGAILSFRFPISLSGTNVFERNEGGGIALIQSRVDVGGVALFIENSAVDGAGLALEDQCLVININNIIYNFLSKHNSANPAYINIYTYTDSSSPEF